MVHSLALNAPLGECRVERLMMSYPFWRLNGAVEQLCCGKGNLAERLIAAVQYLPPLLERDFPEEFQKD
ncbi:hypothetical protein [Hirschia litorea]|uniref:Uncharacterized protein n=1 Tax=Hirschia litorea TaxID=1199156 RepID=A0ABW2IKU0_9PROT